MGAASSSIMSYSMDEPSWCETSGRILPRIRAVLNRRSQTMGARPAKLTGSRLTREKIMKATELSELRRLPKRGSNDVENRVSRRIKKYGGNMNPFRRSMLRGTLGYVVTYNDFLRRFLCLAA